ncbi:MAG TPA: aromatic ring-hydroxylating dioxygenase subunit alpha, partial [Hellea balneolensis]|nr:aromatic ring-hydroxylating dioxygenase subunit alpha [Hellea balneolensis]
GRGQDGKIFALRDICPHRAAPLSAGRIVKDSVECPYHGWRFGFDDGQCLEVPSICAGQKDPAKGIKVRAYPVRECGNIVWVYIAKDPKFTEEPKINPPEFDEQDYKPRITETLKLECHVDQAVIGLMDPAHVSYLHRQWWWRSESSLHEKTKRFEPRERGFAMAPHAPSSNSYGYKLLGGKPTTEIRFQLPGIRTEHIHVGKKRLLSFTAVTPVDDKSTIITQTFFTNMKIIPTLSPIIRRAARTFLNQDGDMIKLQAECFKHNPRLMLIGDADQQARWYYMIKKEWAKSRTENREFVNPVKPIDLSWRS